MVSLLRVVLNISSGYYLFMFVILKWVSCCLQYKVIERRWRVRVHTKSDREAKHNSASVFCNLKNVFLLLCFCVCNLTGKHSLLLCLIFLRKFQGCVFVFLFEQTFIYKCKITFFKIME